MATSNESQTSNTTEECSICLSPLTQQGLDIFTTSCQHKFHFQCLAKNVQAQNNECPLCRTRLDSLVNILNASSSTATLVPVQNVPIQNTLIQQVPAIQTTPPANSTGFWGTLTRKLSNAFGWTSSSSNTSASLSNHNNRRSTWSVSN
jgi:hypothetical protein